MSTVAATVASFALVMMATVVAPRSRDRAILVNGTVIAVIPDENFLGINRTAVTISAYVDLTLRSLVSIPSTIRAGVGFNSGSEECESADSDGGD